MGANLCKNCGQPARGAFCEHCGQSTSVGRLQLSELAGQVLDAVVDWDGRLWITLRRLTSSPGRVCAEYVEGKRLAYLPPLRYCLLALLLNLLMGQVISIEMPSDLGGEFNSQQQAVFASLFPEFRRLAVAHSDWIALVCVPFLVLLYRAVMWARGRNIAECGAFVLYLTGHLSLIVAIMSPIKWMGPLPAAWVRLLVFFALYVVAARTFFAVSYLRSMLAAVVAALATFVISFLALLALAWAQGSLQPAIEAMRAAAP